MQNSSFVHVLFSVTRQLRVPRVALHRHLFTSLLLNAIAVIAFKGSFLIPATTQGSLITKVREAFLFASILMIFHWEPFFVFPFPCG
jgi:hypothetical protein